MSNRVSDTIEAWRVFIAIELPQTVRHRIKEHIDRLRTARPDVRASWTRAENLHLTLKFMGDTPVARVEALSQALRRAATRLKPFDLVIRDCGVFPPRGKPNVFWIGISPEAQAFCQHLFQAIEDEGANSGFAREKRPFHPHLTIARLRNLQGARELATLHQEIGFEQLSLPVNNVCLIRSELSSQGSRYTVIARHELSG